SFLSFLAVVIGLMLGAPPFATVMDVSKNLKKVGQPVTATYTLLDMTVGDKQEKLDIFIKAGSHYESDPQPLYLGLTYTSVPQIVVWMETLEGEYIDTLYITGKSATSGFGGAEDGPVRRPEALPYWSHSRGIQEQDGFFAPHLANSDLDGISGATPKNDYLISLSAPRMGQYRLLLEVNRSYNFNEYYSPDRFPDDPIYSGDGSSGQPSLVYATTIDPDMPGQQLLSIIGHGHHSGADGKLYTDLSNITTAKDILSFVVAKIE
ncbi:MAG TPA: hypothetical protein VIC08_09035, partial [Cellvibrionaceae bacterium]